MHRLQAKAAALLGPIRTFQILTFPPNTYICVQGGRTAANFPALLPKCGVAWRPAGRSRSNRKTLWTKGIHQTRPPQVHHDVVDQTAVPAPGCCGSLIEPEPAPFSSATRAAIAQITPDIGSDGKSSSSAAELRSSAKLMLFLPRRRQTGCWTPTGSQSDGGDPLTRLSAQ